MCVRWARARRAWHFSIPVNCLSSRCNCSICHRTPLALAVATLAFALGEQVLWTREVAIPGQANLVSVEFALPGAVNAGDALHFHVRNHGYNSWQLSPLMLAPLP